MNRGDKLLLVMTATITPAPGIHIARADPEVRRADYYQAFRYWLQQEDPRLNRILLIENSGADLSDFRKAAEESGKEVELMSVPPNPPPPEMHYGYSELEMIDQGLAQSRLRLGTSHMVKTTGRLIFPALSRLLDRLPEDCRLAADARARLPFRPSERGFIATQLFVAEHSFFDSVLRKGYNKLAPSGHYPHFLEHLFFEFLAHRKEERGVLLRFPVNCEPSGFAAHTHKRYDTPSRIFIMGARAAARKLAPDFWL